MRVDQHQDSDHAPAHVQIMYTSIDGIIAKKFELKGYISEKIAGVVHTQVHKNIVWQSTDTAYGGGTGKTIKVEDYYLQ